MSLPKQTCTHRYDFIEKEHNDPHKNKNFLPFEIIEIDIQQESLCNISTSSTEYLSTSSTCKFL